MPLDDGSPVIEVNLGLQFLEYTGSEVSNIITANELRATDVDTPTDKIMYVITDEPQYGRLEKTDRPKTSIVSFSQGTPCLSLFLSLCVCVCMCVCVCVCVKEKYFFSKYTLLSGK